MYGRSFFYIYFLFFLFLPALHLKHLHCRAGVGFQTEFVTTINHTKGATITFRLKYDSSLSPLHSTPLHSTPLHSTPLHSTPLHSAQFHSPSFSSISPLGKNRIKYQKKKDLYKISNLKTKRHLPNLA
jgi:hypothetical protein